MQVISLAIYWKKALYRPSTSTQNTSPILVTILFAIINILCHYCPRYAWKAQLTDSRGHRAAGEMSPETKPSPQMHSAKSAPKHEATNTPTTIACDIMKFHSPVYLLNRKDNISPQLRKQTCCKTSVNWKLRMENWEWRIENWELRILAMQAASRWENWAAGAAMLWETPHEQRECGDSRR